MMKKTNLLQTALFAGMLLLFQVTNAQTVSDFETLTLPADSFWDGSDLSAGFADGDAYFNNSYDTTWNYWSGGFAYSNMKDSTTAGASNMYSASTAIGYNSSANYVVGKDNAILRLTGTAQGDTVSGFYVTNSTYAYISMRDGDSFAKQFGDTVDANGNPDGTNGEDWFLLTVKGYSGGALTTDSVNFYLADYRFANDAEDYIVTTWEWVDLTGLGAVDSLTFQLSSSDVGSFGMNTPAYYCMDNFNGQEPSTTSIKTVAQSPVDVKVYPNPAVERVCVKASGNVEKVEVVDMQGRLVLEAYDKNVLNLRSLKQGYYIVRVKVENSFYNHQLIKE